jgi:hypothetical protein
LPDFALSFGLGFALDFALDFALVFKLDFEHLEVLITRHALATSHGQGHTAGLAESLAPGISGYAFLPRGKHILCAPGAVAPASPPSRAQSSRQWLPPLTPA